MAFNPSTANLFVYGNGGDNHIVSVNKEHLYGPPAGGSGELGAQWLNGAEVGLKTYPPTDQLLAVSWPSKSTRVLYEGEGFKDFTVGGNRWAVLTNSNVAIIDGVQSQGIAFPWTFGTTGYLAYRVWHRDGLRVCRPGEIPDVNRASDILEPDHVRCEDPHIYRHHIIWRVGQTVKYCRLLDNVRGEVHLSYPFGWVTAAEDGMRLLVQLHRYDLGLIAFYLDDPTHGWIIQRLSLHDKCYRNDIALLNDGRARSVWSTLDGDQPGSIVAADPWLVSAPLLFDVPATPEPPPAPPLPPVDPEEPEEPEMEIPNDFAIVQRINEEYPHLIAKNTPETIKEFYWRVIWALHQKDPRWGMLSKSAGENGQVIEGIRVSVDAIAYKDQTPIVDILKSAGDGPGTGGITWGVDPHRRDTNLWVQPLPFPTHEEPEEPGEPGEPEEPSNVEHRVATLESEVRQLRSQLLTDEKVRQLITDALAGQSTPDVKRTLHELIDNGKLRLVGRTGKAGGAFGYGSHSHEVNNVGLQLDE
jgi:hypothetical protein